MKNNKLLISIGAVVLVVIIAFSAVMISKYLTTKKQQEEINSLKATVSAIEEENSRLDETLSNSEDESYVEKVARDSGYVYPEERIYYDSDAS